MSFYCILVLGVRKEVAGLKLTIFLPSCFCLPSAGLQMCHFAIVHLTLVHLLTLWLILSIPHSSKGTSVYLNVEENMVFYPL
jgi:hypothetical protein